MLQAMHGGCLDKRWRAWTLGLAADCHWMKLCRGCMALLGIVGKMLCLVSRSVQGRALHAPAHSSLKFICAASGVLAGVS
jgi:hypothetical protein